jgi:hypothetical protein
MRKAAITYCQYEASVRVCYWILYCQAGLIAKLRGRHFEYFTEFVMGKGGGAEIAYGSELLGSEMSQYTKYFILVNLCYKICRIQIINNSFIVSPCILKSLNIAYKLMH